jgi:hypothetical protein
MKTTRPSRRPAALVLATAVALAAACAWALPASAQIPPTPPNHDTRDIRHKVADGYGVHSFPNVERVSFTFNVKSGERESRRSWTWWPEEGRVRYDGGNWHDGVAVEYTRDDLANNPSEEVVAADQRFINDSYWFMFPYRVEWDIAATVTDEGMAPMPIGDGGLEARKVVVAYPKTGGYTPGDIYELYVSDDYRVLQWVYRPEGSETERSPMTWEDDQRFGDVSFCTNHVSPSGTRIFFTEISVEFKKK